MNEIVQLNAIELSDAVHSQRCSAREVTIAYLDHIERLNAKVNAIVSLRPRGELLAEADERDRRLARGEDLGWMHGFPLAVKDLAAAAGLPLTRGFLPFKDFVPQADDIFVARMRAAGAIVIGKTNTPEFGLGSHTYNKVFGTTLNAYDKGRTAGGSSGGAAVAVALRMLPIADGSDHAGSLRNPAAFNNVFALRPTFGRVPSEEAGFEASLSVIGPMARTVPDLAMLLSIMAGHHPRAPLSLADNPAIFRRRLEHHFKVARIGWLGNFGGYLPFEPGVLDLCRDALRVLESMGCVVEDVVPRYPAEQVWSNWLVLRAWGARSRLKDVYDRPEWRRHMKPEAQWEVERAAHLSIDDISRALDARAAYYRAFVELFERFDFLIAPSAQVFPFNAKLDWPKEIADSKMDTYHRWMEVCVLITMTGCPALGAPVGFSVAGLPMGMQIIAPPRAELACLELAYAYDRETRWVERRKPPQLLPLYHCLNLRTSLQQNTLPE